MRVVLTVLAVIAFALSAALHFLTPGFGLVDVAALDSAGVAFLVARELAKT